jgi:hypothetical protein
VDLLVHAELYTIWNNALKYFQNTFCSGVQSGFYLLRTNEDLAVWFPLKKSHFAASPMGAAPLGSP